MFPVSLTLTVMCTESIGAEGRGSTSWTLELTRGVLGTTPNLTQLEPPDGHFD